MVGSSPLSGLVGGLAKAKQFLNLTSNNNNEDFLAQRHGGSHVASSVVMVCAGRSSHQCAVAGLTSMCRKRRARSVWCAHAQSARSVCARAVCARTLNRRAAVLFHVDTCIFSRDKTGLTMGKPEVNFTFIPSLIQVYLRNSARVRYEVKGVIVG